MNLARLALICGVCLLTQRASAVNNTSTNWNLNQKFVTALVAEVPAIVKRQDTNTGRFKATPWACDDQNVIFPLAVAWWLDHPANPFHHDRALLETIMKAGDALIAAQDKYGMWEFRKRDNSYWGQTAKPWTYSRWVRAFYLIKDAMPADRRQHWEKGLKLGFERIGKSLRTVHNIPCHHAMGLYYAGVCLDRADWQITASNFMAKVVAAQSPHGYWSENHGPVVNYNFVYSDSMGAYYALSGDSGVLGALRRAALFHNLFTYPDGTSVETIDERNPTHYGKELGNVGFSLTPEGRRFLIDQQALVGDRRVDADTAASFLLHGKTGPATSKAPDEQLTVFGDNQALILRRKPWFVCMSAFACKLPENRWIQDRQNFVSIFHDQAGLIIGGGNTKLQPFWSSFTVGDTAQLAHKPGDENPDFKPKGGLLHIPSSATLLVSQAAPAVSLRYGPEECSISVRPLDDRRLVLTCAASRNSGEKVEGHVTFLPQDKAKLVTASGKSVALSDKNLSWSAAEIGAWFQYGKARVSMPPGARLLWPMKRHNPYKKDGSSTLSDARLVICLPFSETVSKPEILLEIVEAVGTK